MQKIAAKMVPKIFFFFFFFFFCYVHSLLNCVHCEITACDSDNKQSLILSSSINVLLTVLL